VQEILSLRLLIPKYRQKIVDKFQMPFTLNRHSGIILIRLRETTAGQAGIHHKQRPKTWIPAKTFAGMT
jgi:hypothetical protein